MSIVFLLFKNFDQTSGNRIFPFIIFLVKSWIVGHNMSGNDQLLHDFYIASKDEMWLESVENHFSFIILSLGRHHTSVLFSPDENTSNT